MLTDGSVDCGAAFGVVVGEAGSSGMARARSDFVASVPAHARIAALPSRSGRLLTVAVGRSNAMIARRIGRALLALGAVVVGCSGGDDSSGGPNYYPSTGPGGASSGTSSASGGSAGAESAGFGTGGLGAAATAGASGGTPAGAGGEPPCECPFGDAKSACGGYYAGCQLPPGTTASGDAAVVNWLQPGTGLCEAYLAPIPASGPGSLAAHVTFGSPIMARRLWWTARLEQPILVMGEIDDGTDVLGMTTVPANYQGNTGGSMVVEAVLSPPRMLTGVDLRMTYTGMPGQIEAVNLTDLAFDCVSP